MRFLPPLLAIALFAGIHGFALVAGVSWDRVEGVTVSHQMAADAGTLQAGGEVGRVPLYGSAWYRSVALLGEGPEGLLAAGRILSILSCLLLSLMGFLFLRRRGVVAERAAAAATLWLTWSPALQFGGLDRCDAPALLLASVGWMLSWSRSRAWSFAGGCIAGLSSLVRPTSGPEALVWFLAGALAGAAPRWRHWLAGAVLGGTLAFLAVLGLEGAAGLARLSLAGAAGPDPRQALDLFLRALPQAAPVLAAGLLVHAPRTLAFPVAAALLLGIASFLRPGASLNWLLGPSFLLSLSLSTSTARIPFSVVVLLCLQTVAVQLPWVLQRFERAGQAEARVRAIAASPLPVLTSETLSTLLARRRVPIEDPHLLESLDRAGALGSPRLEDSLRAGRWAVLADPDLQSGDPRFWSSGTAAWVRDSMHVCVFAEGAELAFPRSVPCPTSP
jgi:hypothetical protein